MLPNLETILIVVIGIGVGVFVVYRVVKTVRGGSACGCGCGCSHAVPLPTPKSDPDSQRVRFTVSNMHCGNCEQTVKRTLSGMAGVLEVSADHQTGHVVVRHEGGEELQDALRAKLNAISFEVQSMEQL